MRKNILASLILLLASIHASAQTVILDANDKLPVVGASIFDASGTMVGLTLSDGSVPEDLAAESYPLTIQCIGYNMLTIEKKGQRTLEMTERSYEIDEVKVTPGDKKVLRLLCYVREYVGISAFTDTTTIFKEHMVDYLIPVERKAKLSSSCDARILTSRIYTRSVDEEKDTVEISTKGGPSLLFLATIDSSSVAEPESFKDTDVLPKSYTKTGKYGPICIYRKTQNAFTCFRDGLADEKNHIMSPAVLKLLGARMDFTQLYKSLSFRMSGSNTYGPADLTSATFALEAIGMGKFFKSSNPHKKPVEIKSLMEIYVAKRYYLTTEEAKQIKKNKPEDTKFIIPASVPQLSPSIRNIVKRAQQQAKD